MTSLSSSSHESYHSQRSLKKNPQPKGKRMGPCMYLKCSKQRYLLTIEQTLTCTVFENSEDPTALETIHLYTPPSSVVTILFIDGCVQYNHTDGCPEEFGQHYELFLMILNILKVAGRHLFQTQHLTYLNDLN